MVKILEGDMDGRVIASACPNPRVRDLDMCRLRARPHGSNLVIRVSQLRSVGRVQALDDAQPPRLSLRYRWR